MRDDNLGRVGGVRRREGGGEEAELRVVRHVHVFVLGLSGGRGAVPVDFEEHEVAVVRDAALCQGGGGEGDAAEGLDGVDVELFLVFEGLSFNLGQFFWGGKAFAWAVPFSVAWSVVLCVLGNIDLRLQFSSCFLSFFLSISRMRRVLRGRVEGTTTR